MKSILKLFPVALGVLALASCSNDDFFGSGAQNNGQELVPTVEKLVNADGETTRSAWTAGGKYQVSWQTGDVFRAYDNAVQAYDIYSKKEGAGITIDGAADVDAHKYAIFPGNQVSYAGWDKVNGLSAVMKIDDNWIYSGESKATFSAGEVPVYHSDLPMWGPIANETSEDLQVALSYLTSVLDVCVYQKKATHVRVVAFADNTALQLTTPTFGLGNLADQYTVATPTPLSGYFFAQLKDGGQLVTDMTQPAAMTAEYGYALEVALPTLNLSNEAHVLIPVVPATYNYLSVQYSDDYGTNWTELKGYADTDFKRAQVRKSGLEIGDAPITAHAESLKDLNRKLAVIANTAEYAGKIVNIFVDGTIKTGEDQGDEDAGADPKSDGKTLIIPDMGINNQDLFVNIIAGKGDGIIHNTYTNNSLKIEDATGVGTAHANHTATINFVGGLIGTESIIINTTAGLRLGGTITSSNNKDGYKHKTIDVQTVNPTSGLTLGIGAEGDLNTDMNVKLSGAAVPVLVDANEGTIPAIDAAAAANTNNITVMSGNVTAIGANTAAATLVTIGGGEVGNVTTKAADVTVYDGKVNKIVTNGTGIGAGDVWIYGGTVADVSSAKSNVTVSPVPGTTATATKITTTTGAVTVNADAIVDNVTTAATGTINTITVNANITNLKLSGAAPVINLIGTTTADDDAVVISNLETTDAKNKQIVDLRSYDKAAVGNVTFAKSDDDINAMSFIWVTDAEDVKTSEIGDDKVIYTAAQLAGIGAGNYKLNTDVNLGGATWTPVDLSGDFKLVKNHSITGLNAPLFNKVTGTSTIGDKNLTISGFTYTGAADEDNLGIIAKEVDGATVTIKNVLLTGTGNTLTGDATSENVGAAIGKANVSTKLVLEGLNFANLTLTGHANVGGFIGNVVGGNVEIKKGTTASTIDFALVGTYDATDDDLAGTFGNIIGSVTGTAKITIGAKGNTITNFINPTAAIDNTNYQSSYSYNSNVNAEGGKFSGMYGTSQYTKQPMNYEIGYSPATSIKVTMYGVTKDPLGNDVNITEKDINQFND